MVLREAANAIDSTGLGPAQPCLCTSRAGTGTADVWDRRRLGPRAGRPRSRVALRAHCGRDARAPSRCFIAICCLSVI